MVIAAYFEFVARDPDFRFHKPPNYGDILYFQRGFLFIRQRVEFWDLNFKKVLERATSFLDDFPEIRSIVGKRKNIVFRDPVIPRLYHFFQCGRIEQSQKQHRLQYFVCNVALR